MLERIECKRRNLFHGLGNRYRHLLWPNTRAKQSPPPDRRKAGATEPVVSARRNLLLWEVAQLPQPLFANLLRLLMEGGTVADRMLRSNAQDNSKETNNDSENKKRVPRDIRLRTPAVQTRQP